jgi:hypothetical protein
VLKIVEHQEEALGGKMCDYSFQWRARVVSSQIQRFGNGPGDHLGLCDSGQIDPDDPIDEIAFQLSDEPKGKPSFPNATRSC